jgi:1-deoxy-D-xylulose-5-phosphate synthase
MNILSKIQLPKDLKKLERSDLQSLCSDIRDYLVEIISTTGGHFASSLGVVELSVALHYCFDTPKDLLIWDVGHQAYAHKILTGRKEALKRIRQFGGISGFTKRSESPYDAFGTGHASTSISAALGLCTARDLKAENYRVVAIIGDGSLTGGLAYEGLNNAGQSGKNLLVILNDNNMSISPNVGAIAYYLNEIITNPLYQRIKNEVWDLTGKIPPITEKLRTIAKKTESSLKAIILPGTFFEDLGFRYFGPVNGHDLNELISYLNRIKDLTGPVLLHVLTKKGKGFLDAEINPEKYHGIKPLTPQTSSPLESPKLQSYTEVFGKSLVQLAEENPKICAITAAMCDGTGLNDFHARFSERFFDVGIAEEHAVTYAAGLAAGGFRPVVSIYSTFLQRSFDQIIHDVALQKLPVILVLDRGGLVGEDGPTHHGSFDLSYLNLIPELIIASPKNGQELRNLLYTATQQDENPFVIRYPRDLAPDIVDPKAGFEKIEIGSWEVIHPGENILILAVGSMVQESIKTLNQLKRHKLNPTLVNCRFIKPIDESLLQELLSKHRNIFTIEENSLQGGFGQKISSFLMTGGYAKKISLQQKGLPDKFITHGERSLLLDQVGLSASHIEQWIVSTIKGGKENTKSLTETSLLASLIASL